MQAAGQGILISLAPTGTTPTGWLKSPLRPVTSSRGSCRWWQTIRVFLWSSSVQLSFNSWTCFSVWPIFYCGPALFHILYWLSVSTKGQRYYPCQHPAKAVRSLLMAHGRRVVISSIQVLDKLYLIAYLVSDNLLGLASELHGLPHPRPR